MVGPWPRAGRRVRRCRGPGAWSAALALDDVEACGAVTALWPAPKRPPERQYLRHRGLVGGRKACGSRDELGRGATGGLGGGWWLVGGARGGGELVATARGTKMNYVLSKQHLYRIVSIWVVRPGASRGARRGSASPQEAPSSSVSRRPATHHRSPLARSRARSPSLHRRRRSLPWQRPRARAPRALLGAPRLSPPSRLRSRRQQPPPVRRAPPSPASRPPAPSAQSACSMASHT